MEITTGSSTVVFRIRGVDMMAAKHGHNVSGKAKAGIKNSRSSKAETGKVFQPSKAGSSGSTATSVSSFKGRKSAFKSS